MVFLAVISAIASAAILIVMGCVEVFLVIKEIFAGNFASYAEFSHNAIAHLVTAIDYYLIGTVFILFGIGLYGLFINKIDAGEIDENTSHVLIIKDLDQLKNGIAKVIIMVLIVTFFKYAVEINYTEMITLLYLSIGILLIAVSVYLTKKPGNI